MQAYAYIPVYTRICGYRKETLPLGVSGGFTYILLETTTRQKTFANKTRLAIMSTRIWRKQEGDQLAPALGSQ